MPTSRLSLNTRISLKQTVGKRAKAGYGLGKDLQGIKKAISTMLKHDHHGLGYQFSDEGRKRQIKRQKGKRMASSKLIIPPIHQTFRFEGYINSSLFVNDEDVVTPLIALTINVIIEDEEMVKTARPTMYPCPSGFELSNCSIVEIPVVNKSSK